MSWDAAWANAFGNSWDDPVLLSVAEIGHAHAANGVVVSLSFALSINEGSHANLCDNIAKFAIPELRLVGTMSDENGLVTDTGLELIALPGTNLYSSAPVLRSPSVSVSSGQIAIQNSVFLYGDIGSDYLVVFYDPGPPARGGGPHPATVVDANA